MADKRLTLRELAVRIDEHLNRFENDPEINKPKEGTTLHPYFHAGAYYAGRGAYVAVRYVSFQGTTYLNRVEAEKYLQKLDAGFVGTHWRAIA